MKLIPLSQGKFAQVNDRLYKRLIAMGPWHFTNKGYAAHCVYNGLNSRPRTTTVLMHRIVLELSGLRLGRKDDVDHRDTDRLNCRRRNLRVACRSSNVANSRRNSRNTTGYKGVTRRKGTARYRAYITVNYARTWLGEYDTAEKAAEAYNRAARKMFGRFARVNKVHNRAKSV
jgi:hypothetical protein